MLSCGSIRQAPCLEALFAKSSHQSDSGSGYWQLELDRDLVDTIAAIYPEWFKNNTMAEGGSGATSRDSPPKAIVDTTPLLNTLEQNKESLKVKLMLRRPFDQLVAQGIMPPHKTPAAYHGQRRQLERAKTGDILKAKIQQRPSRQELERRHILDEDPGHVDPSLAERQRMLKKARLADQLNDQLSHRPGPLELIQKNILHTEEPIESAVKSGRIPYKATCEGQLNRPQHPHSYVCLEDDSQSSEGDALVSPGPSDVIETAAKSAGIVVSLIPASESAVVVTTATPVFSKDNSEIVFADLTRSVGAPILSLGSASSPASLVSSTSTLSPLSSIASPIPQPPTPAPPPMPVCLTPRPIPSPTKTDAPGKDKNRKKSKSKSAPKARTIKFHEYKGPPSAQKNSSANSNAPGESSYDLLLQQQTLLLQFQLQLQHKYPQIILPASQKNTNDSSPPPVNPQPPNTVAIPSESPVQSKLVGRLEDMKVSDLKAELKRRSLPVSGSKPQLIERLKPFTGASESVSQTSNSSLDSVPPNTNNEFFPKEEAGSPSSCLDESLQDRMDVMEPVSPMSPQSMLCNKDDLVREQQRQIEELQRELTISQLKLQAATRAEPKAQLLALQKHLQARQQNQQLAVHMQQLQALHAQQAQEQQRIQQQQHVAFQNQKNLTGGLLLNGNDAATVLNHLVQGKAKLVNGHSRANSLPNFINTIVTPIINQPEMKMDCASDNPKPPPPQYEEATKQIKKEKNYVKSQIVDDVLEILIKNGELPPSAAQDPSTPGSAGTKAAEPVFPSNVQPVESNLPIDPSSPEAALGLDASDLLDTLDTLESMDFSQLVMELGGNQHGNDNCNQSNDVDAMSVPMDTDDWLESLLPHENQNGNTVSSIPSHEPDLGYDPLLTTVQDPFDPFSLEEFRSSNDLTAALSWDKVDFAA
ncbi:hypothetical protein PPYR_09956 [Photinus pyralis]|uniref:SAP domain-containing protein n=1 Tax=Photinus pyralis TaxID=7054 RepID=A0A1Y1N098_PHOPY|nr:myocardin-related transcription factor B isoform X2 [Photinus pyralis]XP_031346131.1 myocardin-related transcription factor B isoform X2 [Photinus pyralis]KAB0795895.1 hypothetical protein PPYR_09956 [Photinus pyralis]